MNALLLLADERILLGKVCVPLLPRQLLPLAHLTCLRQLPPSLLLLPPPHGLLRLPRVSPLPHRAPRPHAWRCRDWSHHASPPNPLLRAPMVKMGCCRLGAARAVSEKELGLFLLEQLLRQICQPFGSRRNIAQPFPTHPTRQRVCLPRVGESVTNLPCQNFSKVDVL